MKVYVAGKISDLNKERVCKKFKEAENFLLAKGHDVLIPIVSPEYKSLSHEDYMHICYAMIDVCDAVYMLDNWRESAGAKLEYEYACSKNKEIIYE